MANGREFKPRKLDSRLIVARVDHACNEIIRNAGGTGRIDMQLINKYAKLRKIPASKLAERLRQLGAKI